MPITRRRALTWMGAALGAAAGGVALVDARVLPGRSVLNQALGRCAAEAPPDGLRAAPGPRIGGTFRSAARRREVSFALSYPPGYTPGARLPVCLALHGYASDAAAAVGNGDYPAFIAGAVRAGAARSRWPPWTAATGTGTRTRTTTRWRC
ncbi:hypothetical protein [Micromonospora sp. DT47]|uniref:hypothetical protein n=1 Tax=Micromonospora sp. DT47 TaxID=3393431 RepID=UPI003CE9081A